MAVLTVQGITRTGLQASYTAVASSHTFDGGDNIFLHVVNGSTAMNVTAVTSVIVDGKAVDDNVVNVGSNEDFFIGPFPKKWYGTTVTVQFDDTSNGTCAAIKLPSE